MILIDSENNIIGNSREMTMSNFFHSLLIEKPVIPSGKYTLIVDVIWDDCCKFDEGYDDVLVRVYTSENVFIQQVNPGHGTDILALAFKNLAKKSQNNQLRQYYREQDESYGQNLWRISDPSTNVGYYGYVYRRNDSSYSSNEKLILELSGLHFVSEENQDFLEIPSGGDDLILMRCDEAFGATSYGMQMAWQQRAMSDSELIQKARDEGNKGQLCPEVEYAMLLTNAGGVLIFDNNDGNSAKAIKVDISGSSNLRLDGGETFTEKTVTVQPNNKGSAFLRLLTPGVAAQL